MTRRRRVLVTVLLPFALVAGLTVRALTLGSRQPRVTALTDERADPETIAARLQRAVRRRTISGSDGTEAPGQELSDLASDLERMFPNVHATLSHEAVSTHSLLYTWRGRDPTLAPLVFCAHLDVVPVEPGTESSWSRPPFDGAIEGGFVWGRGTLDDKATVVVLLSAVERLIGEGFAPARTTYLAFGHDEEIGGGRGAAKIVELLTSRNVHAEMVLDEGGAMVTGIVPGIRGPVAAVGVAEKGYLTIDLRVEMTGGHSSTPARDNALTVLAQAVLRLREQPMPARVDGATKEFLEWLAPEMALVPRVVLSNLWLTSPLVAWQFSSAPVVDASIRTSTAITIMESGVKDNVVPATATATANFRILPGDTTEMTLQHVREAIHDARVVVTPRANPREPSRLSPTSSRTFELLARTVREIFPGAVVAPSLVLGGTDGRRYEPLADAVYRFTPVELEAADLGRIHGKDERISLTALADADRFYRRFLRVAAGP
jgi:carboxypeptidase PM20D1